MTVDEQLSKLLGLSPDQMEDMVLVDWLIWCEGKSNVPTFIGRAVWR